MHRYLLLKTFNNVKRGKKPLRKREALTQESAKMKNNKFPGFKDKKKKLFQNEKKELKNKLN
jgi:hypothetical protein